jgi:hypothetical protein
VGYIYLETDRIMVYEFQCINAYDRSWLAGLCFCIKCSGNGGCTHTIARRVQTLGHHSPLYLTVPQIGAMATQQTLPKFPLDVKFRVLIIGRSNSGKTTILQRVCKTTESPEIYSVDSSGRRKRVRPHP